MAAIKIKESELTTSVMGVPCGIHTFKHPLISGDTEINRSPTGRIYYNVYKNGAIDLTAPSISIEWDVTTKNAARPKDRFGSPIYAAFAVGEHNKPSSPLYTEDNGLDDFLVASKGLKVFAFSCVETATKTYNELTNA